MRLAELAHGRDNNFQLIRFLAATAVILFHCYALTNRWTDEPLWRLAPELDFGSLGVKVFFVVSGFLVTQSWLERRRIAPFAMARVLRIYPALVCATLFTIALAAWSSALPLPVFIGDGQTQEFAWQAALGWQVSDRLPGAYTSNPFPDSVNGSLWTLPIELRLYVVLGVAGVVGLLARRRLWVGTMATLVAIFSVWPQWFPLAPNTEATRQLALLFALGSAACAWRNSVTVSIAGLAVALALVIANPFGAGRGALFAPLLAYMVLVFAYHPRLQWPAFNRIGDYSYGLYVYAFPIQQTLVRHFHEQEPLALFVVALPLTLAVAALSWHLAEQPALRLKSRFR